MRLGIKNDMAHDTVDDIKTRTKSEQKVDLLPPNPRHGVHMNAIASGPRTESSVQKLSEQIRVISAFGIKGGCGKSTLALALASAMKRLYPHARIGLLDMTTEQATLSTVFAPKLEAAGQGWWAITKAFIDEVERENNPNSVAEAIRRAVVPLQVLPDAMDGQGTIDFIGCGKRQLKAIEGHSDLVGAEAVSTCAGVLQEIRATLGWDWAVVDLPPSTKEVGSRMMLGNCSAVAVTAGLTHRDDLSGYAAMVQEIRRLEIEPAGFLLNRYIPKDVYSETALEDARKIFEAVRIPELGLIRERQTMKSSRKVHDWAKTGAADAVGLYVAKNEAQMNEATRGGITHTIHEVESAARAVVQAIVVSESRTAVEA